MDHRQKELEEGGYQKVSTGNEAYDSGATVGGVGGGVKPPLVRRPSTGKCKLLLTLPY